MASFREYRGGKFGWKPKKRIPVFRSLCFLALVYAVYASGAVQKVWNVVGEWRRQASVSPEVLPSAWSERCERFRGSPFPFKNSLGRCSWVLDSPERVSLLPENDFVRYAASVPALRYPLAVHWIADTSDFGNPLSLGVRGDSSKAWFFHLDLPDSSAVWVDGEGCRALGPCPHNPLMGGAIPILSDFDFEGREALLLKDLFSGIGEAPVFPVLPGKVVSLSEDSSGFRIYMDHGGNLFSRISGLPYVSPGVEVGGLLLQDEPIGRLSPNDSSSFYLEILRNGRFVRWKTFYDDAHVAEAEDVESFRRKWGI